ncbi:hypothetical protein HY491_04735 [Candidatus Woesearchaeota archaeon]|nr:hypothetical protein [Candidatus Woesearchaeota archaeon]
MGQSERKGGAAGVSIVDRVNAALRAEVEKIGFPTGLEERLKSLGVEEVRSGYVQFRKKYLLGRSDEPVHIHCLLMGLMVSAGCDDRFNRFYTRYNRYNPFRIEVLLEYEDPLATIKSEGAPEGTIVYAFGKWVGIPYTTSDIHSIHVTHGRIHGLTTPVRHVLFAVRPEHFDRTTTLIHAFHDTQFLDLDMCEYRYKPISVRLGNERATNYAALTLSRDETYSFRYDDSDPAVIADKWLYWIPGLKESFSA